MIKKLRYFSRQSFFFCRPRHRRATRSDPQLLTDPSSRMDQHGDKKTGKMAIWCVCRMGCFIKYCCMKYLLLQLVLPFACAANDLELLASDIDDRHNFVCVKEGVVKDEGGSDDQGNSKSQCLGKIYDQANSKSQCLGNFDDDAKGGLVKNEGDALQWYLMSADQGNSDAQYVLGVFYDYGKGGLVKDESAALQWYRQSADQGNPYGQHAIGLFYEYGLGGVVKDESLALQWYRMSADQGNAYGQYKLGMFYEYGKGGLVQDESVALQWYRMSADQGYAYAQYKLGVFYEYGKGGLVQDESVALQWYRKSADQGFSKALRAVLVLESRTRRDGGNWPRLALEMLKFSLLYPPSSSST
jgi:TPR repeat protein